MSLSCVPSRSPLRLESALAFQCSGVGADGLLFFSAAWSALIGARSPAVVPCCMVSESRKMFYKSVSSVPGSDRLKVSGKMRLHGP